MPLHDIPHDERFEDIGEILVALLLQWIRVRAGHTAGSRVLIEVAVDLALVAIETILLKREWKTSISKVRPVKSVDRSLDSKKAFDPVINMSYCSDA